MLAELNVINDAAQRSEWVRSAALRGPSFTDPERPAPRWQAPGQLTDPGCVIEVGHICSGHDVDTPDDLEAIRDEARAII